MSEKSPGLIRRIFTRFWKIITWLRVAFFNLIFLLFLFLIIASLVPQQPVTIEPNNQLVVTPYGFLVDQYTYVDPYTLLLDDQKEPTETLVSDLVEVIDLARDDDKITSMVLQLDRLAGGGISKLEEVGAALARFSESGKPIYAYGENLTQQQYYLASYADHIHLNPLGSVLVDGFSSYRNYFKDALDHLEINMHVFRTGDYKDAMEPFLRNDMSQASKENNQLWLNELWGVYSSRIEELRDLPKGALNDFINNMDDSLANYQGDTARLALESGLVDELSTHVEWHDWLSAQPGDNELDYRTYYQTRKPPTALPSTKKKVAVITARGVISQGDLESGEIGDVSFANQLERVRDDRSIKALVVRIDSGGGGVQASENIRLSLLDFVRERSIPVVVSMGSVAASGGYWMATAADEIWATPTTITGSIGVFAAFPTLENSLSKLGINTDGLATTELAGAIRVDRPLTPMAKNLIQQSVDHMYQRFLGIVSEARDSSPDAIDKIAQGRVWSGNTALELGLVDNLGNLEDVIGRAAELAELREYDIEHIIKPLTPMERFMSEITKVQGVAAARNALTSNSHQSLLPTSLTAHIQKALAPWHFLDAMDDPRGFYALCAECVAP